jgi:myosin heavy subunit
VPYNINGWLEKNKDPLNDTVVDQFKKGTNKLVQDIFADHPGQSGGKDDAGGKGIFVFSSCTHRKKIIHQSFHSFKISF